MFNKIMTAVIFAIAIGAIVQAFAVINLIGVTFK